MLYGGIIQGHDVISGQLPICILFREMDVIFGYISCKYYIG